MEKVLAIFFIVLGLLSMAGSIGNWDWFFLLGRSQFTQGLSRNTNRIMYFMVGFALAGIGGLMLFLLRKDF